MDFVLIVLYLQGMNKICSGELKAENWEIDFAVEN